MHRTALARWDDGARKDLVTELLEPGITLGHAELHPVAEEPYHMLMERATKLWTVAERDRLPDDGNRYEVVYGELFVTPMPVPLHQEVVKRLFLRINAFVDAHDVGSAYESGTDVIFSKHNVVVPDIAVYTFRGDQLPKRWVDAPKPILVVEVRSESTWRRDVGPKRRLYVEREVPEYWIVNHEEREVTVVRPGEPDTVVRDILRWRPPSLSASLEIALADLFR